MKTSNAKTNVKNSTKHKKNIHGKSAWVAGKSLAEMSVTVAGKLNAKIHKMHAGKNAKNAMILLVAGLYGKTVVIGKKTENAGMHLLHAGKPVILV